MKPNTKTKIKNILRPIVENIVNEVSDESSYYRNQLNKVDLNGEWPAEIRLTSSTGSTNYININKESIAALIKFLKTYKGE